MIFLYCLAAAAVLGGLLGAALSHVPGKGRGAEEPSPTPGGTLLTAFLLAAGVSALFFGVLFLRARSVSLTAVVDCWFPDRFAKLLACGLLFGLCCLLGFCLGVFRAGGLRRYFRRVAGSRLHRAVLFGALGGSFLIAVCCAVLAGDPAPAPVRLSEVCCANFTLRIDPDTGEYGDYIELVNTGDQAVDLEGYFLSDRAKKRSRFRLPSLTLAPGEYVLLWADGTGKTGTRSGTEIHLNFSLAPGDTVWFSSPHGVLLDHVTVPERHKNVSLSLLDGTWVQAQGTPGSSNEGAALYAAATLEAPTVSLASGFYAEPQTVTLAAPAGCEIRYTLDGSLPTADSPLYTGPLTLTDVSGRPNRVVSQPNTTPDRSGAVTEPVDKGTVLRAAAFDGTGGRSETVTAVWFIGETFSKYAGRAVLSLVAEPWDLFGDSGILVTGPAYDAWLAAGGKGDAPAANYERRGRLSERTAAVLLWDEDRDLLLDTACGIRVQGSTTRSYAIKRFTFYARPVYGTDRTFSSPIFGDFLSHSFSTRSTVHEAMAQALGAELGLGGLAARPAVVFVNGELYEETWLRDRYDEQYFETNFGADRGELILIEDGLPGRGTAEDFSDYTALIDEIAAGDCSDPAFYAAVCEKIDPESYAAFMAVNLYLKNTDWSELVNYRLWRTRDAVGEGVLDGRWRWLVFDMDSCFWTREAFGDAPRASYDIFTYPSVMTGHTFLETPLFRSLLRSPDFRTLFARTWLELANVRFTYEAALPLLERFSLTEDAFWPEFLRDRPAYAVDQLIEHILPGERACGLTLGVSDPAGGAVLLDGLEPAFFDGTWTGTWVTGVPLTLTAQPAAGWRFLRWEGGATGTEPSLILTPGGDISVVAVFEPVR